MTRLDGCYCELLEPTPGPIEQSVERGGCSGWIPMIRFRNIVFLCLTWLPTAPKGVPHFKKRPERQVFSSQGLPSPFVSWSEEALLPRRRLTIQQFRA